MYELFMIAMKKEFSIINTHLKLNYFRFEATVAINNL